MDLSPLRLGTEIANSIVSFLFEGNEKSNPIVILPGRFQPFHAGHYHVYKTLVDKYGPDNVYIATSDKTEPGKSPLNFDDKQKLISKMFGIDPGHIIKTRVPYAPVELLSKMDPNRPAIFALGEKDADRLTTGKYFSPHSDKSEMEPFKTKGYVLHVPDFEMDVGGQNISGTAIRDTFAKGDEEEKRNLFKKIYGKFDEEAYQLLNQRFSGSTMTAPPSEKGSVPTPDITQTHQTLEKLLHYKIKNPETGNDILVGSALKYEKNHPAYIAADKFVRSKMNESVLLEGGAHGHIQHPYEDMDFKFSDLIELTNRSLKGGLDKDGPVAEKADGQNLLFSYKNGRIVFSRNKGQLKNFGAEAMDVQQLCQKFAGKGAIEASFCTAGSDLQSAIDALSPEEVNRLFADGKKFMSLEIINPSTTNVIPYNKSMILFHGTIEYDIEGNPVAENRDEGEELSTALQAYNAHQQQTYGMQGQHFIVFSESDNDYYDKAAKEFSNTFATIARNNHLDLNNTIGDYMTVQWLKKLHEEKVDLADSEKAALIKRWVYGDKSFGVKHLPPDKKEWFRKLDGEAATLNNKFINVIKIPVLKLGAETIGRITNVLASNSPQAAEEMLQAVQKAIESVRSTNDQNKIRKMEDNLDILNAIGMDKITSSEGLVFNYGEGVYKLTGAFAPVNQIVGMMRYGTQPEQPPAIAPKEPQIAPVPRKDVPPEEVPSHNKTSFDLSRQIINPVTKNNIQIRTALSYPEDHPAHKLARQIIKQD
jgi:hypothetical protein